MQECAAVPRLAYSPDEVMIILGIGKTMLFDLIASGELGRLNAVAAASSPAPTWTSSWRTSRKGSLSFTALHVG